MGVLVFGTGRVYSRIQWLLVQTDVLAFLDNDEEKQGQVIDRCAVLPPEQVRELEYEAVILCSAAIDEMRQQLLALGVLDERIVPYQMIRSFVQGKLRNVKSKVFGSFMADNKEEKRAALFFNELGRSGAPMALLEAAGILCRHGWKVTAYAEHDGALYNDLRNLGAVIVLVDNLSLLYMDDVPYLEKHNLLLVNTSVFAPLLRKHSKKIPVVWWLHESERDLYGNLLKMVLSDIKPSCCHIYTAGQRARQLLEEYLPAWMTVFSGNLYYGRADFYNDRHCKKNKRLVFACIGYFCDRKAQEILVRAIAILPESYRRRAQFHFIGRSDKSVAEFVMQNTKVYPEIKMLGEYSQAQIRDAYREIDVLVCPSRSDTMPIVVTEAMMCHIPCMVSDSVGQAEFISQGQNGWVFPTDDVKKLSELIADIIEKPEQLPAMGDEARKVYDRYFGIEEFEFNLKFILKTVYREDGNCGNNSDMGNW